MVPGEQVRELAVTYGMIAGASVALWPARPRAAAIPWLAWCLVALVLVWPAPGPWAFALVQVACIFAVRALDAAHSSRGLCRLAYMRYVLDASRTPRLVARPPLAASLLRALRGVLLGMCSAALFWMGSTAQLWRTWPYLEDLLVLVELSLLFTATTDLIVALAWCTGPAVDEPHDAAFALTPSLTAFWGRRWNRSFSGSLTRGVFLRVGGRRHRLRGIFATFAVSGLVHALPLLVAFGDRREALLGAAGAMLFFALHGAGVALEGALPRSLRRPGLTRPLAWLTFALSAPLYVPVVAVAIGVHGRPFESLTFLSGLR